MRLRNGQRKKTSSGRATTGTGRSRAEQVPRPVRQTDRQAMVGRPLLLLSATAGSASKRSVKMKTDSAGNTGTRSTSDDDEADVAAAGDDD